MYETLKSQLIFKKIYFTPKQDKNKVSNLSHVQKCSTDDRIVSCLHSRPQLEVKHNFWKYDSF